MCVSMWRCTYVCILYRYSHINMCRYVYLIFLIIFFSTASLKSNSHAMSPSSLSVRSSIFSKLATSCDHALGPGCVLWRRALASILRVCAELPSLAEVSASSPHSWTLSPPWAHGEARGFSLRITQPNDTQVLTALLERCAPSVPAPTPLSFPLAGSLSPSFP